MNERVSDEFSETWYAATYPHSLFEMRRFGLSSLREHFLQYGQAGGLFPSPFAVPRRGGKPCASDSQALFPKVAFGHLCADAQYLYRVAAEQIAAPVHAAWLNRKKRDVSYHEIAAEVSGGEPHHTLHAAIDYIRAGNKKRAAAILSGIDDGDPLSEYHDLLLCMVRNALKDRAGWERAADRYLSTHQPRAVFLADPIPPIAKSLLGAPTYLAIRFHILAPFTTQCKAAVLLAGQPVRTLLGFREPAIAQLVEHIAPIPERCFTTFVATTHVAAPPHAGVTVPITIVADLTRTSGSTVRFAFETKLSCYANAASETGELTLEGASAGGTVLREAARPLSPEFSRGSGQPMPRVSPLADASILLERKVS